METKKTTGKEYHVSVSGDDSYIGTYLKPLKTIQAAANIAQPGDRIIVHEGTYRERINPPRGGESDEKRILYTAAEGEKVVIKGSEVIKGWEFVSGDVWKVILPNAFFGDFNPYSYLLSGPWFFPQEREHHSGAVYLNGEWLSEAASFEEVMEPSKDTLYWFGTVSDTDTTIWAQFKGIDPNQELVEINARQSVFYPDKSGRNYITVRGFIMSHAATPWAPPTTEQIGLIGTNWSKGWVIEDNEISYSICVGITLGKYWDKADDTAVNGLHYLNITIPNAVKNGWNAENVGHHIVRRNVISNCETAGICGSLGAIFSTISDNTIYNIHVRKLFSGQEQAGIKIHGAIDVVISKNHIYKSIQGLHLDWMAQGTRVSSNLFHSNEKRDLYIEASHGPVLVDNNLFLSKNAPFVSMSQGIAVVHNLFAGPIILIEYNHRETPIMEAHSTNIIGKCDQVIGDTHFYNNIFFNKSTNFDNYDHSTNERKLPIYVESNVYANGARPSVIEKNPLIDSEPHLMFNLQEKTNGWYLEITMNPDWIAKQNRHIITTAKLGKTVITDALYENPDSTPIMLNKDYFGNIRNVINPAPGPFEDFGGGKMFIKVW